MREFERLAASDHEASEKPAIGVIGVGWVGLVTAGCFAELGHPVFAMDIDEAKVETLRAAASCRSTSRACASWSSATASGCGSRPRSPRCSSRRLLFCCVDTPPTYSGDADLSRVEAVVAALPEGGEHALVMKSTVPAGTGAAIRRASPTSPTSPARSSSRRAPRSTTSCIPTGW